MAVRPIFPLDATDLDAHLIAQLGIKVRQRLIKQNDAWSHDQRTAKRNALLLAARELVGEPVHLLFEVELCGHICNTLVSFLCGQFLLAEPKLKIGTHGQVGEKRIGLEAKCCIARFRRDVGNILAINADTASGRLQKTGDEFEECGLSTSGWSQQCQKLAGFHVEGQFRQGCKGPK